MITRNCLFAWLCLLAATCQAATINAASCSQPSLQAAVSSAADGDTVVVPAGNCSWTTPITISKGITLQGAGQDQTVITAVSTDLIFVVGNGSGFRMTGIGFTGSNSTSAIYIDGRFSSLRLDHLKFTNLTKRGLIVGYNTWTTTNPAIYGLMDHVTYTNNACVPFALHYGKDMDAWSGEDAWGTSQAFYLEDSTFTWNVSGLTECTVWDQEHGARAVIRHNTITNGTVQGHDSGSTQQARSLRIKELYSNTFICNLSGGARDCGFSAMDFRGGSYLVYDNSFPVCQNFCLSGPPGFENANSTEIWRISGTPGTSDPWNYKCGASPRPVASDFRSHCSGGSFPACGGNENVGQACKPETCGGGSCGTCVDNPTQVPPSLTILSNIDGGGLGGYPCRDQAGRGMDSPDHATQRLTPAYWWNNTDSNSGNSQITKLNVLPVELIYIVPNRDVYLTEVNFTGATGVGRGLLANRPSICTPMVAYFATDTNTLYQCTALNTWTSYYRPYTYPHPLQAGLNPPDAPTGLRVTVVR